MSRIHFIPRPGSYDFDKFRIEWGRHDWDVEICSAVDEGWWFEDFRRADCVGPNIAGAINMNGHKVAWDLIYAFEEEIKTRAYWEALEVY